MQNTLWRAMRSKPHFLVFVLAGFLSQIGSGLTAIAVFGFLAQSRASSHAFAFAIVLTVLPSLFAARLSEKFISKFSLSTNLIAAQVIGALSLILPWWAIENQNIYVVQFAEFGSFLSLGFSMPLMHLYTNRCFNSDEMHHATRIDSIAFSANVVLGMGVGALLFNNIGSKIYLSIDFLSYLSAAILIYICARMKPELMLSEKQQSAAKSASNSTLQWLRKLSSSQKKAFFVYLTLVLGTVPASSLLAFMGTRLSDWNIGAGMVVTATISLLFARALGQCIAPIVLRGEWLPKLSRFKHTELICLLFYNACYLAAFVSHKPLLMVSFIVLAHIASNVLYSKAVYVMQTEFSGGEVAFAFSRQMQISLLMQIPLPFIASYAINLFSPLVVLSGSLAFALAFFFISRRVLL